MTPDDNNGELEELKIDRQLRKQLAALLALRGIQVNESEEPKGSREKRLIDAVLVAAIGALGWALWNLNSTVATLAEANRYEDEAIAATRADVRELQGKTFRGVDGYADKERKDAAAR